MDKHPVDLRENLRLQMIENAAEINRLYDRLRETFERRDESDELREEWSEACSEVRLRYAMLCLPGGWHPNFYDRLKAGDSEAIEVALCFLEVRPYFIRSGYQWKAILQKCKHAPMSSEQAERLGILIERYKEWRRLRNLSSERGAAVCRELWPVIQRFSNLFPVNIAAFKFDGVATVGDLYTLVCLSLKIDPLTGQEKENGTVREPYRYPLRGDTSTWVSDYLAWKDACWTPKDVWATLVFHIMEGYKLDSSIVISSETILQSLSVVIHQDAFVSDVQYRQGFGAAGRENSQAC